LDHCSSRRSKRAEEPVRALQLYDLPKQIDGEEEAVSDAPTKEAA